ncbi:MAG: hypothetical protein A4E39_00023 [Methanoregulaceae archaeon PtaB.Bin152]|nr:MAG: hypothetical protein A4E39_00023 [Methanoregulaceae archaeon PtaB.Bin152]
MTTHTPFSTRERCIIVEEIRKMDDILFGAALELIDQILAGALFSPGNEGEGNPPPREPPYPEYLGRLIYQVAARQDLSQEDRRLLIYRIACVGSEADRARVAERPQHGFPASLRAPARGRNTVTGEEVKLPLSREDLLLTFQTGSLEPFRALLGDNMYRNLADDDPGHRTGNPLGEGMKSDIAGGDEYDAGKQMHEELTFEEWEWDGTEVKITPLDHKREKER